VTELATGQRRIAEVVVDPTTQNLKTLANAITAVGNLQAVADPQTRTLRIFAQPGYTFDFAGRLPSSPNVNITGTTVPTVGGQFTGGYNDTFTFEFLGSGTVGVTPGLQVRVKNGNGDTLATVNVGQGYSPGDEIDVLDGINFRLASGTANAGDSFDIRVTGQPDTAGVLAALGVNTFFAGSNASNVRVNPEVAADVDRLAASKSGQPADGANLRALAGLRGSLLLDSNTRTFRQFYAAIVGDVGTQVRQLDQQQTGQQVLTESLLAQQQSISGVDTNEELVQLLQFQKSFQLAATYISVVNETLEDLVRIAQ
jgi:flagellar hook-associated protein FlgK